MSHELNFKNGKASLFVARDPAWHGLGHVASDAQTSKEAIVISQLDFPVKKGAGYIKYATEDQALLGKGKHVENTHFTYRVDTGVVLCSNGHAVTDDYQIIQNVEAFDFFDSIVGDQLAIFETAGALRKGETVFVTAKFPEEVFVGNKDKINQYLLITLNHDGTAAVQIKFTPIRVVCNNTLTAALYGKGTVRIRHSKSYKDKMETAKQILGLEKTFRLQLAETADKFANIKVQYHQLERLVCEVFLTREEMLNIARFNFDYEKNDIISTRKQNIIRDVINYTQYGIGQNLDTCNETLWGFVNGVTGYYQNSRDYLTNGLVDNEKKFNSIFYGDAANKSQMAFNVAKQFEMSN